MTKDFRNLWFASFNELIATLVILGFLIYLGNLTVVPIGESQEIQLVLSVILTEFGSQCFIGLIFISILSMVFSFKKSS